MIIHHLSVGTNDIARAQKFYNAVMDVLRLRLIEASDESLDYGVNDIFFSVETPTNHQRATPGNGVHIAFAAGSRRMVDEFHAVALAHGGKDAGPPGLRPQYDAHYYGAFVLDPDGNKLEAVTNSAN